VAGVHIRSKVQLEGKLGKSGTSRQDSRNPGRGNHFGISEIRDLEGGEDREFDLTLRTPGMRNCTSRWIRGRITAVDLWEVR
jgi:hypothetical protein